VRVLAAIFMALALNGMVNAQADVPKTSFVVTPESVSDSNVSSSLFFYSMEKLKYLGFMVNDVTVFAKEITTLHEHEYAAVYMTREKFKLADIKTLEVHAQTLESGDKWVDKLTTSETGTFSVTEKLHPVPSEFKFRNVALIDAPGSVTTPSTQVVENQTSGSHTPDEVALLNAMIQYRGGRGLTLDEGLRRVAMNNAVAQANRGQCGHFADQGYRANAAQSGNGPNVAMRWYNSPRHRANMLSGSSRVGIAYYNGYWSAIFQ
jgi:uncharacterized protein YkwD